MIVREILKIIGNTASATSDILDEFFADGGKSYVFAKVMHPEYMSKHERKRNRLKEEQYLKNREKQILRNAIFRLKKQGFIQQTNKSNKKIWQLTRLGKEKVEKLLNKINIAINKYEIEKSNDLTIITFDIPQKLSHLRHWLRASLINMEFTKLQKSVWRGKVKIPEEFIKDLHKYNLAEHIYIFRVAQIGNLSNSNK